MEVLVRRVAMAAAAALCLSSVTGVLGVRAAEAAVQTKSAVTVTVTVSPPTEVYGVLNQVFSVTIAPPASGDISPTGVVTVSELQVDLCPPISLPASGLGRGHCDLRGLHRGNPCERVDHRRIFVLR